MTWVVALLYFITNLKYTPDKHTSKTNGISEGRYFYMIRYLRI